MRAFKQYPPSMARSFVLCGLILFVVFLKMDESGCLRSQDLTLGSGFNMHTVSLSEVWQCLLAR